MNNTLINYIFRIDGDKWKLEGVKVTDENNQETTLTTTTFIGSSYGFSYHTPLKVTFNGTDWELNFKTLQVSVVLQNEVLSIRRIHFNGYFAG